MIDFFVTFQNQSSCLHMSEKHMIIVFLKKCFKCIITVFVNALAYLSPVCLIILYYFVLCFVLGKIRNKRFDVFSECFFVNWFRRFTPYNVHIVFVKYTIKLFFRFIPSKPISIRLSACFLKLYSVTLSGITGVSG